MSPVMLYRFLPKLGFCSRKESKQAIFSGLVLVNGKIVKDPFIMVLPTDKISYKGKVITQSAFVYYMLHKPQGYVCTTKDDQGRKTVMDLIKSKGRLYPVGRLDLDTTGLLLITNDSQFLDRVLDPHSHVSKTYLVHVDNILGREALQHLRQGVIIDKDYTTKPCKVRIHTPDPQNFWVSLTITEGKFHQVKKMIGAVGGKVLHLHRISLGRLSLGDLKLGAYRQLTSQDLLLIFED